MEIKLYKCTSDNNVLNKTLEKDSEITLNGTLKNECSIIDPVIEIDFGGKSKNLERNYLYIEGFDRYYFIKNITVVNNNIMRIEAHVDVLMSFKSSISSMKGIVNKTQTNGNWYINDSSLVASNDTIVSQILFPQAFDMINGQEYILVIAGEN